MEISNWQKKKIEVMADYQEAIADLYALFSAKIPEFQYQFLSMAMKNINYANWLRSVPDRIGDGYYRYGMMRFRIEPVMNGLEYIRKQFEGIESRQISPNQALGILNSIESGDIALKFYEIVHREAECDGDLDKTQKKFRDEKRESLQVLRNFTKQYKEQLSVQ